MTLCDRQKGWRAAIQLGVASIVPTLDLTCRHWVFCGLVVFPASALTATTVLNVPWEEYPQTCCCQLVAGICFSVLDYAGCSVYNNC